MAIKIPAAIALPITPATFGPIACMSKKLLGSSFCPSLWTTRAAIGTAETPAAPIIGFTLPFVSKHISFPPRTPNAVARANAKIPNAKIKIVLEKNLTQDKINLYKKLSELDSKE